MSVFDIDSFEERSLFLTTSVLLPEEFEMFRRRADQQRESSGEVVFNFVIEAAKEEAREQILTAAVVAWGFPRVAGPIIAGLFDLAALYLRTVSEQERSERVFALKTGVFFALARLLTGLPSDYNRWVRGPAEGTPSPNNSTPLAWIPDVSSTADIRTVQRYNYRLFSESNVVDMNIGVNRVRKMIDPGDVSARHKTIIYGGWFNFLSKYELIIFLVVLREHPALAIEWRRLKAEDWPSDRGRRDVEVYIMRMLDRLTQEYLQEKFDAQEQATFLPRAAKVYRNYVESGRDNL